MSELEFEGSFEEQWGTMKTAVRRQNLTLYGNGQPGIVEFITATKAQFRLILILLAAIGALCGIGTLLLGLLEYNRQAHQGLLKSSSEVYSTSTISTIPTLTR